MKTFYSKITSLLFACSLIAIVLSVQSCSKEVETKEVLGVLTPAKLDQTAGTWTPVILTNYSTQVPVAAPSAVTSAAYVAEIAAIKDAQSNLTKSQKSPCQNHPVPAAVSAPRSHFPLLSAGPL